HELFVRGAGHVRHNQFRYSARQPAIGHSALVPALAGRTSEHWPIAQFRQCRVLGFRHGTHSTLERCPFYPISLLPVTQPALRRVQGGAARPLNKDVSGVLTSEASPASSFMARSIRREGYTNFVPVTPPVRSPICRNECLVTRHARYRATCRGRRKPRAFNS